MLRGAGKGIQRKFFAPQSDSDDDTPLPYHSDPCQPVAMRFIFKCYVLCSKGMCFT